MLAETLTQLANVPAAFKRAYSTVYYVTEGGDWVIERVGMHLARGLRALDVPHRVVRSADGLRRQVIHFGSRNAYLSGAHERVHPSNRVVFTWFHGSDEDPHPDNQRMIRLLPQVAPRVARIVTAANVSKERLLHWGVPEEKIALIPLGVDLRYFRPAAAEARRALRRRFGVPDGAVCIGSFQKDGNGWGEGLEPKRIKGPDILLETLTRLAKRYPIFVLLTGPARGYVKRGLEAAGIPYHHDFLRRAEEVVSYYQCLDLYLVTSRDEGGPESLLECLATAVPMVSTRVGMSLDVIRDGENGQLADVEDIDGLTRAAASFIDDALFAQRCANVGLVTVQAYDWAAIARRYHTWVYRELLA